MRMAFPCSRRCSGGCHYFLKIKWNSGRLGGCQESCGLYILCSRPLISAGAGPAWQLTCFLLHFLLEGAAAPTWCLPTTLSNTHLKFCQGEARRALTVAADIVRIWGGFFVCFFFVSRDEPFRLRLKFRLINVFIKEE